MFVARGLGLVLTWSAILKLVDQHCSQMGTPGLQRQEREAGHSRAGV